MSLRNEINSALKEAMKEKAQLRLSTLRLITAAIKDRDISARAEGVGEGDFACHAACHLVVFDPRSS